MARTRTSRRIWLQRSAWVVAGSVLVPCAARSAAEEKPAARLGLLTDVHHADKAPSGTRYYRESLSKMAQAVSWFRDRQVDCLVELGDVIDSAPDLETEKAYLRRVWQALGAGGTCYPVLGNHCVSALAKPEFLEITARARSYYAFDLAGFHFVVLDACFRKDGESYGRSNFQWTDANIPAAELNWLAADLRHTPHSCIVFVHQRLDAEPPYGIGNAAEVRRVLESSGKVLAVFQGHYHPGAYSQLQGIHYCTLAAMIEGSGPQNNAYAMLEMWPGGTLRLSGQHRQESYHWPRLS